MPDPSNDLAGAAVDDVIVLNKSALYLIRQDVDKHDLGIGIPDVTAIPVHLILPRFESIPQARNASALRKRMQPLLTSHLDQDIAPFKFNEQLTP